MKKNYISIFISYLLLYLGGCYSMQQVPIAEFSPTEDYPELIVISNNKEYLFKKGNYTVSNDTIYGEGEVRSLHNNFESFEGTISLNDIENIKMNKTDNNSEVPELLVRTKDKEFIFKSELSSYFVNNDTIYGSGKCRERFSDKAIPGEFAISINDSEEIQVEKFNLLNTILLSYSVVLVSFIVGGALTSHVSIWQD